MPESNNNGSNSGSNNKGDTSKSLPTSEKMAAFQQIVANTTALLGRLSWMANAGLTHDGNRDLWEVFGYSKLITPQELYTKYRRQGIAKTIVEFPADALWSRPPKVTDGGQFDSAWKALLTMHDVWDILRRADYTTGFGRYGIILLGLDDGKDMETPAAPAGVGRSVGERKITYMQPYSELGVSIIEHENDTKSPRYGKPKFYQINPAASEYGTQGSLGSTTVPQQIPFRVHWSRVIHIACDVIEDPSFGIPRLEPVFNDLVDLLKVAGGTAETYWLTSNRGMQVNVDPTMQLSADDLSDLSEELDEYIHNLRRVIRTRGVEVKELGTRVPSSKDAVDTIVSLIAATVRIPKRILFGSEQGSLASEQDRSNWAERVQERRSKFGNPRAIGPLISRLVELGVLPEPDRMKLNFDWPEAFVLAPLERAQTSAQKARSAANLSKVIETHEERLITIEEARNIIGLFDQEIVLDPDDGDPNVVS